MGTLGEYGQSRLPWSCTEPRLTEAYVDDENPENLPWLAKASLRERGLWLPGTRSGADGNLEIRCHSCHRGLAFSAVALFPTHSGRLVLSGLRMG